MIKCAESVTEKEKHFISFLSNQPSKTLNNGQIQKYLYFY